MILGKKKTVLDIPPKEVELSKGNGSDNNGDNNGGNAAKEDSDACIWGNKGNALVESSMYAEAIKCYDKAIEINPRSMEAWNNKGLALARTGRLAEAIQCYDKALELNPDDMEVMYNKGISLALLGKPAEAIGCYDKILAINPEDADAWCSRGDVLLESGRFEEALAAYDKSITIDPKDETAWNNRGMALVKLNRLTEAIESYDKALELNPKVEKIWSNKGLAIAKLGETNYKIDLRKVAASLPKEDTSASQATGAQPALTLKEEMAQAQVPLEPVEKAVPAGNTIPTDKVPTDRSAATENAPLNNQTEASETKAPPEVPHQADIQSDMITPEPPVEKTVIKPDKQKSEPEMFIEKAESIANDKLADIEKYLLSLPADKTTPAAGAASTVPEGIKAVAAESGQPGDKAKPDITDKTEGIGNADTGTTAQSSEIKAAPAIDAQVPEQKISDKNISGPGQQAVVRNPLEEVPSIEGACQNQEPLNEVTTPPTTSIFPPEQVNTNPIRQELKPEPSDDKAVSDSIDKATNAGKCIVSVPVDTYIMAPFIDKHLQVEMDTGGQESDIGLSAERTNPDERTDKSEKIKKSEEYLITGNTLYSLGKYEDAIDSYNKSLNINPQNNTTWNNKGLALSRAGKLDEAIDCYDKALGLSPDDHVVLNNKGSVLYKKGDIEGALQCYRSALGLKPDNRTAKKGIKICTSHINNSVKTKGRE